MSLNGSNPFRDGTAVVPGAFKKQESIGLIERIQGVWFNWEIVTGTIILERWEKVLFNATVASIVGISAWSLAKSVQYSLDFVSK